MNKNNEKLQIRNSTAEFLIFTSQTGENSIEVMVADENVWLTTWRNAPKGKILKSDVSVAKMNYSTYM